jgi:hypothetical protein
MEKISIPNKHRGKKVSGPNLTQRKVDGIVDLHDDAKVSLSIQAKDDRNNPTSFDGTIVYSVDNTSVVSLTDNGDGTAVAASTGTLGTAVLSVVATRANDGQVFNGAEAINVIPSGAVSIQVVPGPEEPV